MRSFIHSRLLNYVSCAAILIFAAPMVHGQWTFSELAPMPESVSNNAVTSVQVDGKWYVYSFSGIDSTKEYSGIHKRCFKLDVEANEWSRIADLPNGNGRIAAGASVLNGKIYVVGGYEVFANGGEISVSKVHVYDPVADIFLPDAVDLPVAIDDHVQDVWRDSLLYIVTGWSNSTNVTNVQVYNPVLDSWSQATVTPNSINYKVFGGSGAIIGDTIYYAGGAASSGGFPATRYFRKGFINPANPMDIQWTGKVMQEARGYRMAASTLNQQPIWFGGSIVTYNYDGIAYNGTGGVDAFGTIKQFDTAADTFTVWEQAFPPNMDFRGIGKLNDGRFILAGGMIENQTVTNRTLLLKFDENSAVIDQNITSVLIQPNPFFNAFEIATDIPVKEVAIYNAKGRLIDQIKYASGIKHWTFGNGVFYLNIELNDGSRIVKKIVRID